VCVCVCMYHNIRYQRTVVESDEGVIDTIVVANASYYSARMTTAPTRGRISPWNVSLGVVN
jgi:hypothetical protein